MKNRLIKKLTLLVLSLVGWSRVSAQEYDFKVYSVNDGLPHAQVHDIHQTRDGFIWFATFGGGLTRFDGNSFVTYTTDDGLNSNAVQELFEDSQGRLWVAANPGGVRTFERDSLINPFPDDSLSAFEVYKIKELNEGEIWFATYEGGIFILREDGRLKRLTVKDGLISNSIWDFHMNEDGSILIGTQKGLSILDATGIKNITVEDGLSGNMVYSITRDRNGNIWMATNDGITVWDGKEFRSIKKINGIPLDYVFDIQASADGKVWIGTETKGVFTYDGEKYHHLTRENGLSSNYVYALYEDRNQNMWIATDENGVNLFRGDAFVFYGKSFGLSTDEILSIQIDNKGVIWFGTTVGMESYNGVSVQKHKLPATYENNYIWEIEGLPNGNLLVVMPDNTLMEYDGRQFVNFSRKNNLGQWFIYDVFIDSDSTIWIGTDKGLFNLNSGILKNFTSEDGLAGNIVQYIYEGISGKLFIGTTYGLSVYDGEAFKTIRITDGLAHNVINFVTQDVHGNVWLGTGGGVSVCIPDENSNSYTIHNFGKPEGMRLVDTHFLWFDRDGDLWQGTNGGLNRLNVPGYWESGTMNLTRYSLSEGGLGMEFNFKAVAPESENVVWLGSMKGALKLDTSKLVNKKGSPVVHITGIEKDAQPVQWNNFTDTLSYYSGRLVYPSVTFPYGESSYMFTFAGLDYSNPEGVHYRYKMEGFENDWRPVTTTNQATYTNLDPGDYTFMVQTVSGSNDGYSEAALYHFSIASPFWQTYWFYSLVLLSLCGLIYGYIKIRLGMLEKRRLKELVDEQTKDLQEALAEKEVLIKEIHHRVKNNLAVISGLLELQRGYSDNEFARRVLAESQRRVQSISMIHEKLYQNEKLSEINFIRYTEELVQIIAYSFSHQEREISINTCIDDIKLGVDQGIPCGLILNELISNAYEHAFNGKMRGEIEVGLHQKDQTVILTVKDDGVGLSADFDHVKSTALGLTLVETLTRQLGGALEVESSERGTLFSIVFTKESYKKGLVYKRR